MIENKISYKDFLSDDAVETQLLAEMYEGDQLERVQDMLDGKISGFGERHDWRERGIVPRFRNLIKPIIDKSGLLFNRPPTLDVWIDNQSVTDETLSSILYDADWLEFFQNVDVYTRLLKTTVVLIQQYIPPNVKTVNGKYRYNGLRGDACMFSLLHRGNCVVKMDAIRRNIEQLAYVTSEDAEVEDDKAWTYRVITPFIIEDWIVENDEERLLDEQPNVLGIVPAVIFNDTNKPVHGVWNELPNDLMSFQDFFNSHLTDTEFAIAWQKQKTLFVDADILDTDNPYVNLPSYDPTGLYSDAALREPTIKSNIGGLGSVVRLNGNESGSTPLVKFDGPDTDLKALNDIVRQLLNDIANDWDVNLRYESTGGSGSATSGFQLVVEEIGNLNLREKRAQYFQAGFRKLYEVLKILYPELTDGQLLIVFAPPSLPVNRKEQEEVWSMKISEGRASIIDYLKDVEGLDEAEAIKRAVEINKYNAMFSGQNSPA